MNWTAFFTEKEFLLRYHTGEEFLIAFICFVVACKLTQRFTGKQSSLNQRQKSQVELVGAAFVILGISSLFHAIIHAWHLNQNLLYQTLLGYSFGLLTMIVAISSENPLNKKVFLLLYLPLLSFLLPGIYEKIPIFGEFRPLVWISIAYLSGLVCMLLFAAFYRTRNKDILWSALGFSLICISHSTCSHNMNQISLVLSSAIQNYTFRIIHLWIFE